MNWIDIAGIIFVCVTANHLGLVKAIEEELDRELTIVNCPKCGSFWCTLVYTIFVTREPISSLAISFLASYIAIWLELFEGFIDSLYNKVYEKIYSNPTDNTATSDTDKGNTAGAVS